MKHTKKIIGITAHPDDHLMFAGTVMKLCDQGYEYYEILLTDGSEGGVSTAKKNAKIRSDEFQRASQLLATKKTFVFHEHDQNLTYSKKIMHDVMKIIRQIQPEIAFATNSHDVHPDHVACSTIAKEALRFASKDFQKSLGKPHRTPIVLFAEGTIPVDVSVLVDITNYYSKKEELFKVYDSQVSSKDLALMKSFATIRGYHLRTKDGLYAEGFTTEEEILPIIFP